MHRDRPQLDGIKTWFAANTNHSGFRGSIADALDGADVAAARAIAGCVDDSELETGRVVPAQLDRRVAPAVAAAVARAAREPGVIRKRQGK